MLSEDMIDPVVAATELPVLAWATAVWERRLPFSVLQAAFTAVTGAGPLAWATVRGPTAATVLSLQR
eukprot:2219339-Lingulodinium_polyedra.AAC.1